MSSPPRSTAHPLSSRTVLALTEALEHGFDAAAWARLGVELDMPQLVDPELRLQKSLRFSDDDYGYCVAQFVRHLEAERPGDLHGLARRPGIRAWLDANAPGAAEELGEGPAPVTAPPASAAAREAVEQALADAPRVRDAEGPVPAIHRLHDALHAFLRDACARADVAVADRATVAELHWSLTCDHPLFAAHGRPSPQVAHALASMAGAVTALNTLRSDASIAHADAAAPGEAEVVLMADLVRALSDYVNSRLQAAGPSAQRD